MLCHPCVHSRGLLIRGRKVLAYGQTGHTRYLVRKGLKATFGFGAAVAPENLTALW